MVKPMVGAVPLALAVVCAGTAVAEPVSPTPAQPGVTQPESPRQQVMPDKPSQPGVTTPAPATPAPAQSAPDTDAALEYAVPAGYRPVPAPQSAPVRPIVPQELHAPVPVEQVAPIAPPPRTLRVGDFSTEVPLEVPDDILGTVNTTAAGVEAQVATAAQSVGIDPARADKVAGGALLGAGAAGLTGAVVGGVGGGLIGAAAGLAVGVAGTAVGGALVAAITSVPTAGIGAVVGPLAAAVALGGGSTAGGAALGAAIGAAVIGIPAAVVGGLAGGAAGAQIG